MQPYQRATKHQYYSHLSIQIVPMSVLLGTYSELRCNHLIDEYNARHVSGASTGPSAETLGRTKGKKNRNERHNISKNYYHVEVNNDENDLDSDMEKIIQAFLAARKSSVSGQTS